MKLAVIGYPVSHSLSPYLFARIAEETGIALRYGREEVRLEELPAFLQKARERGYDGFNVTMPLKSAAAALSEEKAAEVVRLGAANTLCIRDGKSVAYNTDGAGFLLALKSAGAVPDGKRALILGAGGAARAIALALAESGAEVRIKNRTPAHAESVTKLHPRIAVAEEDDFSRADILVNATPQGMTAAWETLDYVNLLRRDALVFDCVYAPRETQLTQAAAARGLPAYNGLPMLAGQAIVAARHFLGVPLDEQTLLPRLSASLKTLP